MAAENDKTPGNGNLGLKGVWAQMTNMTAVLLICLIFYQDRHAALDAAREDRQMFREELRGMHEDSQKQWQAIHQLTIAIKALTEKETKK